MVGKNTKVDWIIHYILEVGPGNTGNSHTHGMETYDHFNFQVVLNYEPDMIKYLLNTFCMRVQQGERFEAGQMVSGLFTDCNIRLDLFKETGRDVLRLIIPDKNNRFPDDPLCEARYKCQLRRMYL